MSTEESLKPFKGQDKIYHAAAVAIMVFAIGFLLAMFNVLNKKWKVPFWAQLLIIIITVMTVSTVKELWDKGDFDDILPDSLQKKQLTGFSLDDLMVDTVIMFVSIIIWTALYYFLFCNTYIKTKYSYMMEKPADFTVEDEWEVVDES